MTNRNWAQKGWGNADPPDDASERSNRPHNFWMPPGATKRIMFLDAEPFCLFEHSLFEITRDAKERAICLERNSLDSRGCPLCRKKLFPSFVGYFSVIDMGDVEFDGGKVKLSGWTSPKGIHYQFQRKLFGAKRGSAGKPGILPKLHRIAQKKLRGDLTGAVFDVTRDGAKSESIGNDFEFIESISKKDIREYLIRAGANAEGLVVDPFEYKEVFVPKSYESLARLCGEESASDAPKKTVEGAGYSDSDDDDDDIPF